MLYNNRKIDKIKTENFLCGSKQYCNTTQKYYSIDHISRLYRARLTSHLFERFRRFAERSR